MQLYLAVCSSVGIKIVKSHFSVSLVRLLVSGVNFSKFNFIMCFLSTSLLLLNSIKVYLSDFHLCDQQRADLPKYWDGRLVY